MKGHKPGRGERAKTSKAKMVKDKKPKAKKKKPMNSNGFKYS